MTEAQSPPLPIHRPLLESVLEMESLQATAATAMCYIGIGEAIAIPPLPILSVMAQQVSISLFHPSHHYLFPYPSPVH